MRLFIAVDSSEEVKDYLSSLQSKLNNELARIKLVGKDQMHLTLKFLGDVEESKLKEIKDNNSRLSAEKIFLEEENEKLKSLLKENNKIKEDKKTISNRIEKLLKKLNSVKM